MALDYGTKRTGIAVTDQLQLIASGLTMVETKQLISFLKDYFEAEKVELVLVGEPKQRDGSHSKVEEEIQKFLKHGQAWNVSVTELLHYPHHSLGFHLGCFLVLKSIFAFFADKT